MSYCTRVFTALCTMCPGQVICLLFIRTPMVLPGAGSSINLARSARNEQKKGTYSGGSRLPLSVTCLSCVFVVLIARAVRGGFPHTRHLQKRTIVSGCVGLVSPHNLSRVGHCRCAVMVLVMFCGNISFVVWLRFSVNAHSLRQLTDILASCIYLLVKWPTIRVYYSFGVCLHLSTTYAVYVCLDVLYLNTLISSRLSS